MMRMLALIGFAGLGWLGLSGTAEQMLLYHFDATRILPQDAGEPRLKEVELISGDNTIILWVAPPKAGKPTIVYFHGNAGNLANRTRRFTAFLDRGYGVVAMAYPGSSGSSGSPSQDLILQHAVSVLSGVPVSKTHHIILYGESLGTGVAVLTTSDKTVEDAQITAMVLEAPYTSIPDVAAHLYPKLTPFMGILKDTYPTRDWITKTDIPLLVLHGTDDTLIPIDLGRQVFALAATPDKTMYEVQGAGHNNVWQVDAQKVLWQFFSTHH